MSGDAAGISQPTLASTTRRMSGGITKLRAALELQVRSRHRRSRLWIFQDVDGIGLGEHWPRLLDESLEVAPFLIPVLTPRFFRSGPCRDELRRFLAHERAAGRDDLVLPIYLVERPGSGATAPDATDDLAKAIARRQRWPWQPTRTAAGRRSDRVQSAKCASLPSQSGAGSSHEAHPRAPEPARPPQPASPRRGPSAGRTWQPGHVFRDVDAPWCPEMVVIPAGTFTMGSPASEEGRYDDEGPQRTVTFAPAVRDRSLHGDVRRVGRLRGGGRLQRLPAGRSGLGPG